MFYALRPGDNDGSQYGARKWVNSTRSKNCSVRGIPSIHISHAQCNKTQSSPLQLVLCHQYGILNFWITLILITVYSIFNIFNIQYSNLGTHAHKCLHCGWLSLSILDTSNSAILSYDSPVLSLVTNLGWKTQLWCAGHRVKSHRANLPAPYHDVVRLWARHLTSNCTCLRSACESWSVHMVINWLRRLISLSSEPFDMHQVLDKQCTMLQVQY